MFNGSLLTRENGNRDFTTFRAARLEISIDEVHHHLGVERPRRSFMVKELRCQVDGKSA
jgi:hypothetical protein